MKLYKTENEFTENLKEQTNKILKIFHEKRGSRE